MQSNIVSPFSSVFGVKQLLKKIHSQHPTLINQQTYSALLVYLCVALVVIFIEPEYFPGALVAWRVNTSNI